MYCATISSALLDCMIRAIAPPIFGSNPYSIDHAGLSITPSSVMNSCTTIRPIVISLLSVAPDAPFIPSTNRDGGIDSYRRASAQLGITGLPATTASGTQGLLLR